MYRRSFKEMPAWPEERDAFLAAGGHIVILTQPLGYVTDADGKLTGVRVARTELGAPDGSGRRTPALIPDTETVLPVALAVEAMGQGLSTTLRQALAGVEFTRAGLVKVKPGTNATSRPGVYAGGDMVNGGTTAVRAVVEGMRAAREIHAALSSAAA